MTRSFGFSVVSEPAGCSSTGGALQCRDMKKRTLVSLSLMACWFGMNLLRETRRSLSRTSLIRALGVISASSLLSGAPSAWALPTYSVTDLAALNDAYVQSLVTTVGIGGDYRALQSAAPLGAIIGLDIGFEVALIHTPDDFRQAIQQTTNQTAPDFLPLPRLNIHKGLPGNVDLGFSFVTYSGYTVFGGEVKYAILPGNTAAPAVAVRASYNVNSLFYLNTNTFKFDALVSKNLVLFEPYFGLGIQSVSGDVKVPQGQSLPVGVSGSYSAAPMHFYVGTPLKFGLLHITAEYDHSFAGITTYGTKVSISI